jgi:Ala-tRNA(Pro) deacylase
LELTKDISKQLGVSRLSFGTPEHMQQLLHISPGAVSPMGLLFESARDVRLVLDDDLLKADQLGCHPCVNTATVKFSTADLKEKILPKLGHEYTIVDLEIPEDEV